MKQLDTSYITAQELGHSSAGGIWYESRRLTCDFCSHDTGWIGDDQLWDGALDGWVEFAGLDVCPDCYASMYGEARQP